MNCQNLEDAHDVDDAIACILLRRGASAGVLKIVEGTAVEAVKVYGTCIRNSGETSLDVEVLAKIVLVSQLVELKRQLAQYERQTNVVLVWIAKLVHFRKWRAFADFKRIVEGL